MDFLIDGHQLWVEHNTPYFYGDDGNYLVTSFLKPGKHIFPHGRSAWKGGPPPTR